MDSKEPPKMIMPKFRLRLRVRLRVMILFF
jgi:hypothetical protein